jgi:hypothetical protein
VDARVLELRVRIPPGAWTFFLREGFVVAGGGVCDGQITRPQESYRVSACHCVITCNNNRQCLQCLGIKRVDYERKTENARKVRQQVDCER